MKKINGAFLKILFLWLALIVFMISKGLSYTDPSVPPYGMAFYNIFCAVTYLLIVITVGVYVYFFKYEFYHLKKASRRLLVGCTAISCLYLPSLLFMSSGRAFSGFSAGDLFLYGALAVPGAIIGMVGFISLKKMETSV